MLPVLNPAHIRYSANYVQIIIIAGCICVIFVKKIIIIKCIMATAHAISIFITNLLLVLNVSTINCHFCHFVELSTYLHIP